MGIVRSKLENVILASSSLSTVFYLMPVFVIVGQLTSKLSLVFCRVQLYKTEQTILSELSMI